MSLATLTLRTIERTGRDFLIDGESLPVRGILNDDSVVFSPNSNISPGAILQDQRTGKTFLVSDVRRTAIEIKAALLPFWLRCFVYRYVEHEPDAFHRSGDILEATAVNVPVVFIGPDRAALPANTDVRPGDILSVPAIGERWLVRGLATAAPPGLTVVLLARQTYTGTE